LVAITPACYFVTPLYAILLGLIAGAICALAIEFKYKLGFDDSLDVVGIHLVGGIIGCWYLGFFDRFTGMFTGADQKGFGQLQDQLVSSMAVLAYSFTVAFVVGLLIEKTIGFRVKEEDEIAGLDSVLHEEGYAYE
jgi:Amt family ammonium transporter